jgi:hypothetical protein
MTPRLLLNSTKPKDYARWAREERKCGVCVCVCLHSLPHPTFVFIAGSHGWEVAIPRWTAIRRQWDVTTCLDSDGGACWPGRSAGLPVAPTVPNLLWWLSWAALSGPCWSWPVLACLNWVLASLLVHLNLNRCSDIFCDFMSGQSVRVTCILA